LQQTVRCAAADHRQPNRWGMDSHDYPATHFRAMAELATRLGELPAQVLEHQYSYNHFGSWWMTVLFRGTTFRFVFDGKDRQWVFERGGEYGRPDDWKMLEHWPAAEVGQAQLVQAILDRLRAS